MKISIPLRFGAAFGAPLLLAPALAQAGMEDPGRHPDVIVTGVRGDGGYAPKRAAIGKTMIPLIEIPQSVSVVTREQIEDRNAFTVGEALQQVTGVTVMPFDGSNPDYRARGFVLDYAYDGIPSTFSSGAQEFDLSLYERIEVQRGPTGLFRGSGSPGGTINFVRKRGLDAFAASTALSAGSWGNVRGEFDVGGPIDRAGRLRARAVATYQDRGFFAARSNTRKMVAYGALDYDLTPSTRIGVSLSYQNNEAHTPYNGQPAYSDGRFLNFARRFNQLPGWNLFLDRTSEIAAELEQKIGGWALHVRALQRDGDKYYTDSFVSPGTGVNPLTLTATYNRRRAEGVDDRTGVDAFANGPLTLFGRRHELLVGYSHVRRYGTSYFLAGSQVTGVSILNPGAIPPLSGAYQTGSANVVTQSGFHGQLRLNPIKPLILSLGARISDYEAKSRTIAPSPVTAYVVNPRIRRKFVPNIGATLYVTRDVTLYASYSDIFIPQTARRADNSLLDPRVGKQVEAGVKGRFLNGRLNASAAVFRTRDVNRSLADSAAPGFFLPAGEVKIQGFELEVTGTPIKGLDLTAGYTNMTTRYEVSAFPPGAIFDTFEPRHLYKVYARYEPPRLGGLFAAFGVNGQSGVIGGGTAGLRQQGPFAVANAQLGYRLNPRLRIFASVNNLFDRTYYVRVGSLNTYNFYGDPRNVLVTLRAHY